MTTSILTLYTTAASGLQARQTELDTLSNNVANFNTVGYKRTRATFHTFLSAEETIVPDEGTLQGVEVGATQRQFGQGPLQATGNPWDVAIDGQGLFAVSLLGGGIAYTRDGSFRPDAQGELATVQGHRLLPRIAVPQGTTQIYVDPLGQVTADVNGEPQAIGTLQLAYFSNPTGLQSVGDNLFVPTAASGPAQLGPAGTGLRGQLISGALELANVDAGQEMVGLVVAQRAYGLSLRSLTVSDQMLSIMTRAGG